ncbi:hypothetical protein B0H19DRAFT_1147519 [Mycena capillaripes]|nr:hypothetical protein B0H19DRAFT_1147519 [Mycena capillaripes]
MSPPPEKNKKVSRACNTCRLKRKKCDGLEPCVFCTDTGVECSYSREPRRRGPPSGYLRYTETRVALLETLLGLYIQRSGPQTVPSLHDAVQTLRAESTAHTTQEVWDAYKQCWSDCDAARAVHELAAVFAPFTPAENQSHTAKGLLPPPQAAHNPGPQPPTPTTTMQPPPPPPPRGRSPSPFPATPVALYTNESFERSVMPNDLEQHRQQQQRYSNEPTGHSPIHEQQRYGNEHDHLTDLNDDFNMDTELSMPMPIFLPSPPADPAPAASASSSTASVYPGAYWRTAALASPPPSASAPLPLPPGFSPALAGLPSSFPFSLFTSSSAPFTPTAPAPGSADLPPPHVRAALLGTYLAAVHPALPILSPAQCASAAALEAEGSPMLLLALCAYTARLAPPAVPTRVAADLWYESAASLLASALRRAVVQTDAVQTLLLLALRDHGRARDALAWRGVGAAVRVAVELGLDGSAGGADANSNANGVGISESKGNGSRDARTGESRDGDETWKRGLWGVASMLDLFLSIQLGRAPATAEALRPITLTPANLPSSSVNGATLPSPAPTASPHERAEAEADAELAAHTRALVRIVARVHFCTALGYAVPANSVSSSSSDLDTANINGSGSNGSGSTLRAELVAWHRGLPPRFRVALGGERVPRAVLEAHMLYQVAVGMLARVSTDLNSTPGSSLAIPNPGTSKGGYATSAPSFSGSNGSGGSGNGNGSDAEADDAASTFNVLLDKYRPSLPLAGPPVVWLVFAAARAGLHRAGLGAGATATTGGGKSAHGLGGGGGTARALQTQLYLLNCREALAAMGGTWELARRCARTLERLMEGEASRPQSTAGKRKRGEGDRGAAGDGSGGGGGDAGGVENGGSSKRQREEDAGSGWAEQFGFGAGWGANAELDELGMAVQGGEMWDGDAGLWDMSTGTGAWDEGLWGRSLFGGSQPFINGGGGGGGAGAFGLGLGLFDAAPGG